MSNEDTAAKIDALDCKTNPEHFETLFHYLITKCANEAGITRQQLYDRFGIALCLLPLRLAAWRFGGSNVTRGESLNVA